MAKSKTKKEMVSSDEEMMMWCAYRYAIGRKTYVSALASYIGKTYYNKLSDNRLEFTALDIRRSIADCLHFGHPGFEYEGSVSDNERNPLSDYVSWITDNVNTKEDLYNIEKIVCYKNGYGDKYEKEYDVVKRQREWTHIYESDFNDLFVWEDLASLFDKKKHKIVTINYNNEVKEIECFESWRHVTEPIEDQPGYVRSVAWKYERCYKSVEGYLSKGEYCGSLNPEYIVKVENVEM